MRGNRKNKRKTKNEVILKLIKISVDGGDTVFCVFSSSGALKIEK